MGTRIKNQLKAVPRGNYVVAGMFLGNGTGAIVTTGQEKNGYKVTRNGVGNFSILFAEPASIETFIAPPVIVGGKAVHFVVYAFTPSGGDGLGAELSFYGQTDDGTHTDIPTETIVNFLVVLSQAGARVAPF